MTVERVDQPRQLLIAERGKFVLVGQIFFYSPDDHILVQVPRTIQYIEMFRTLILAALESMKEDLQAKEAKESGNLAEK